MALANLNNSSNNLVVRPQARPNNQLLQRMISPSRLETESGVVPFYGTTDGSYPFF